MKGVRVLAAGLAFAAEAVGAAEFAPKGTTATLTVEYVYTSAGKNDNGVDARTWNAKRSAKITADLVTEGPAPYSVMHEMSKDQKDDLARKQAAVSSAQQKMKPMQADIEKIAAQCGEDEACLSREIQKYGFAMDETQKKQAADAGEDARAAGKQAPNRYQAWSASGQKGTYSIEETARVLSGDPLCMTLPGKRCTIDETRKGGGAIAPTGASAARFELDTKTKSLEIQLPSTLALPYTQTVTTNMPGEKGGTSPGMLRLPPSDPKIVKVPIRGDWKSQSGTETVPTKGEKGEAGTLTIRWQLAVP